MRKRIWKRIAATALTVVLLVTLLPTAAYAAISATIESSDKAAILAELTAITGNQADAEALYARLNALGVLDGDQWVTEDLVINGETYTLDEAWDLVDSLPDDEIVQVGNTNLTVADLRIMLEIEEEIIRIRDLYFNGEDWTPEQQANINLLQEALDNGDFVVDNAGSTLGQSGIDHGAQVRVSGPQISGNTATFTVELTGAAENQTVTFDYQAVSGSAS